MCRRHAVEYPLCSSSPTIATVRLTSNSRRNINFPQGYNIVIIYKRPSDPQVSFSFSIRGKAGSRTGSLSPALAKRLVSDPPRYRLILGPVPQGRDHLPFWNRYRRARPAIIHDDAESNTIFRGGASDGVLEKALKGLKGYIRSRGAMTRLLPLLCLELICNSEASKYLRFPQRLKLM